MARLLSSIAPEHFLKRIHRQVESKQLKQTSYEAIVDGVNKIKRERADWLARPAAKIADKEMTIMCMAFAPRKVPRPSIEWWTFSGGPTA